MRAEFNLSSDTPESIIKPLKWLLFPENREGAWNVCPFADDNYFFTLGRHHQIGENYCGSRDWNDDDYINGSWCELRKCENGTWHIVASSECKNYDMQFQYFLKWLDPYIIGSDTMVLGQIMHEEKYTVGTLYRNGEYKYSTDDNQNYWDYE